MKTKYKKWIDKHYPTKEMSHNKCNEATRAMKRAFPELQIQVGIVNHGVPHCWLKTKAGEIVDPTHKQFDFKPDFYDVRAARFLERHEYEASTGAFFLDDIAE